jgi:threonine dehydratase
VIDVAAAVRSAERRVRPHVLTTPVLPADGLSTSLGTEVLLKCENLQRTGSFKLRGAVSKVLTLTPEELAGGLVTASTGNHGAAVAHAGGIVGADVLVFAPDSADGAKLASIERQGARIRFAGSDSVEAETAARAWAAERGLTYVSPYNDPAVIAGQGSLAVELLAQVEGLATVYVAVGGGGLASGVAGFLKAVSPGTRVIGCSPEASAVMYHSIRAGRILELPSQPTLSDGTAGGVEPGAITFELLRELSDDWVIVSETEIRAAFLDLIEIEHQLVEGSAAMAYAACRKHLPPRSDGRTAVVLCGGNVGVDTLRVVLEGSGRAT